MEFKRKLVSLHSRSVYSRYRGQQYPSDVSHTWTNKWSQHTGENRTLCLCWEVNSRHIQRTVGTLVTIVTELSPSKRRYWLQLWGCFHHFITQFMFRSLTAVASNSCAIRRVTATLLAILCNLQLFILYSSFARTTLLSSVSQGTHYACCL